MAHNYDPTAVYHSTIPVPDDGDPAIAASVNGPLEDLADGLAYGVEPMALGGAIILGGELEFTGNLVTFSGGIDVRTQPSFFHSDVTFNEDVTIGSSAADALTINATATISGAANFTGNVRLGDTDADALTVFASASFRGTNTFLGEIVVDSSTTLTCEGDAEFTASVTIGTASTDSFEVLSGTLFRSSVTIGNDAGTEQFTVNAPSNFEDTVEFNANVEIGSSGTELNVNAPTLFRSNVTLGNGSSDEITVIGRCDIQNLTGVMGFTSAGRVPLKTVLAGNENITMEPGVANVVYFENITADRVATIGSGAESGDQFFVFLSQDSTNNMTLSVKDEDGDTIVELVSLAGQDAWCWVALFPDGEWRMLLQEGALA